MDLQIVITCDFQFDAIVLICADSKASVVERVEYCIFASKVYQID